MPREHRKVQRTPEKLLVGVIDHYGVGAEPDHQRCLRRRTPSSPAAARRKGLNPVDATAGGGQVQRRVRPASDLGLKTVTTQAALSGYSPRAIGASNNGS
jgi:hypothetical protein